MAQSNDYNVREITTGLTRELELRSDPSVAGPLSGSQPTGTTLQPSLLVLKIQTCLNSKTSPRHANSSAGFGRGFARPRGSNGLSPSQSGSSDSAMSGGVLGHFGTTSRNKAHLTGSYPGSSTQAGLIRPISPLPLASTTSHRAGAGRGSGSVNGGGPRTPNSQMCLSSIGRGKNPSSAASGATGCPTAKEPKPKKKRKRASKKPPTTIIYATREQFLPTVQRLTAFKPASPRTAQVAEDPLPTAQLVRPQPERPQHIAVAVSINVDKDIANPDAKPESLPPAMVTSGRCASSSASDRVLEDGTSSSRSEIMNITFGYGQQQFPFALEEHQHQHQNPNPPYYEESVDYEVCDADRMSAQYEGRGTTSTSSVEVAASQVFENDKKEGVSSGPQRRTNRTDSGSAMSFLSNPSPSDGLERRNRPPMDVPDNFQLEDDPNKFSDFDWIVDHFT